MPGAQGQWGWVGHAPSQGTQELLPTPGHRLQLWDGVPRQVWDGRREIPGPSPHGHPPGELRGAAGDAAGSSVPGQSQPEWRKSRILTSRTGLGKTGVPSSLTPPSPTRGPSIVITSHPAPSAITSWDAHGDTHGSVGGRRESPAAQRGMLGMQMLGMEPQASSSWSGSVPHPWGGEGASWRRRRAASHGKKGNAARSPAALPEQMLWQGWHKGQALGHGTALAPGGSPALDP